MQCYVGEEREEIGVGGGDAGCVVEGCDCADGNGGCGCVGGGAGVVLGSAADGYVLEYQAFGGRR